MTTHNRNPLDLSMGRFNKYDLKQAAQLALSALERVQPQVKGVLVQEDVACAIDNLRHNLSHQDNEMTLDQALGALKGLAHLVLEMGHTIRHLDEENNYIEEWTNDGEFAPNDPRTQVWINDEYVPDERFRVAAAVLAQAGVSKTGTEGV